MMTPQKSLASTRPANFREDAAMDLYVNLEKAN